MRRAPGILLVLLVLAAGGCGGGGSPSAPNILLIVTDDQRFDTVDGYMPQTQSRIFESGTRFSNAFVTTPLCCPSRASILTGMYARSHGVYYNPDPLNKPTFVEDLSRAGYYTGLVGKYLNSWDGTPRPEFDFWADYPGGGSEYWSARLNVNGVWTTEPGYVTERLRDHALDFLRKAAGGRRPFFLLFAPNAPHLPASPAPGDEGLYPDLEPYRPPNYDEEDVSDKPQWLQRLPRLDAQKQRLLDGLRLRQLQSLRSVDLAIADLLNLLEERGQLDETMVIFTSDNGHFWGEHRLDGKVLVYEPSIRVPFAIRYPKLVPQGRAESALVANIDIAPTIYELAGLPVPTQVDGRSLLALLAGGTAWRAELLIEARLGGTPISAIRTERYVYIETEGDTPELYDMEADPYQLDSRAADPAYTGTVEDLRQRLLALLGE